MAPPVTAETVERLLALVSALQRRNDLLEQRNTLLEQQNALLRARVAELKRRLGLDSSNSGKPPSSDGPGGPAGWTRSLRETGVRAPGGHPGRTLKRVAQADHVVAHRPAVCRTPLRDLPGALTVSRQVFDLPEPAPLRVTEHRVYRCVCPGCGSVTAGAFSPAVTAPVQYGPWLSATVAYLAPARFLPEERLSQLLHDVLGLSLSAGTIGQMVCRAAQRAQEFAAAVRVRVCAAAPCSTVPRRSSCTTTGPPTYRCRASPTPFATRIIYAN